jgi:hypothetical protein
LSTAQLGVPVVVDPPVELSPAVVLVSDVVEAVVDAVVEDGPLVDALDPEPALVPDSEDDADESLPASFPVPSASPAPMPLPVASNEHANANARLTKLHRTVLRSYTGGGMR